MKIKRPMGYIAHLKSIITINKLEQSYDYTSTLVKGCYYVPFKKCTSRPFKVLKIPLPKDALYQFG